MRLFRAIPVLLSSVLLVLTIALWYGSYLRILRFGAVVHSVGNRYTEFWMATEHGGISVELLTVTDPYHNWSYLEFRSDNPMPRDYAGGDETVHLGFESNSSYFNGGWSRGVAAPAWFWTLITAILPGIWIIRRFRRRRRPGTCVKCGYDLRATPGRCPECGTIQPSAAASPKIANL